MRPQFRNLLAWIGGVGMVFWGAVASAESLYQMDENAIYHFHRGQHWMAIHHYDAAAREFQIGLRLNPNSAMSATLYNNLGQAYLKMHHYGKAKQAFQQAVKLNPHFNLYYENLARAHQQSNSLNKTIQDLEMTVRGSPENAQAWYTLGVLYHTSGNQSKAQEAFKAFLKLAPNSALAEAAKLNLGSF